MIKRQNRNIILNFKKKENRKKIERKNTKQDISVKKYSKYKYNWQAESSKILIVNSKII